MASFADYGVEVSRNREIVRQTEEDTGYKYEELSVKNRKRSYDDSFQADRGNSLSPRHSSSNEAVSSDKRETIHYRNSYSFEKERDEIISTPSSSKRSSNQDVSEFLDHSTATDSPERKKSSKSPSKKARRSSSPSYSSHKKHKHKKRSRSRERHRESRKESDSQHSKRERDSKSTSSSMSKKRSRSPREEERRSHNYSRERSTEYEARRSPEVERRDESAESKRSKFKIPKRKRERSPEEEKESLYEPPVKKIVKVSSSLLREIDDLLRTEHHHIIKKSKPDVDGGIPQVEWCYHYLDPRLPGHITGGRMHLHHFCRVCKRTCLHLLGKYGTGARKCLVCAADEMGWREDEVPSWYFHDTCEHCKNDTKRRGGGGGGGYRGNRYGGYGGGYGNRYGGGYRGRYSHY